MDACFADPPWGISDDDDVVITQDGKPWQVTGWEWDRRDGDYGAFTSKWLLLCDGLLKPGGHLVVWFDVWKLGDLATALVPLGYTRRQVLYWASTHPVPRMRKVDFMSAVQAAGWFVKGGGNPRFNHDLGFKPNYDLVALGGPRLHPTQKPAQVLGKWLMYMTARGDLVLDPFAGSGTTLVAAKLLGRRAVGIESSEELCRVAAARVQEMALPML